MKTSKSWGVSPLKAEESCLTYTCPGLDCRWGFELLERAQHVVGFSTNSPRDTRAGFGSKTDGCIIVECPRCFTKFWHHVGRERLSFWQDNCQNWPEEEVR